MIKNDVESVLKSRSKSRSKVDQKVGPKVGQKVGPKVGQKVANFGGQKSMFLEVKNRGSGGGSKTAIPCKMCVQGGQKSQLVFPI